MKSYSQNTRGLFFENLLTDLSQKRVFRSKTITASDFTQKVFTLTLFFIIALTAWCLLFKNLIKRFQMEVTVDCLLLFGHDRSGSEPECSHAKRYMLTKHRLLNIQSFNGFKILSYLVNSIKISCKNRSVQYQSR